MNLETFFEIALAKGAADPARNLIGTRGFEVDLSGGLEITRHPRNNFVAKPSDLKIPVAFGEHASGNRVVLRDIERTAARPIRIFGSNNLLYVGSTRKFAATVNVFGEENLFFFSKDATANDTAFVIKSTRRSIIVGEDCMFSQGISVRNGDSHAIFDEATGHVLNTAASILFYPHVWVSEGASVMKGVTIGPGSIIGSGSLVNKDVPDRSLAIGTPARVIKEGVSWTRNDTPTKKQVEEIAAKVRFFVEDFNARKAGPEISDPAKSIA
jgi:acetyltransferase-like isoleucine patch superfamily enzyme